MDKNFDWDQIKIDAAINALNALVSNNSHNIIEEPIAKEIYPKIAVQYANHLVRAVNYPQTKDLWASWADSLLRVISPQALISAVPAVLFLQNANRLMLFAASKSL